MIVTKTTIDAMCMHVVLVSFTISPLVEDVFHHD